MSHDVYKTKDLREECLNTGECTEYKEVISSQIAHYESRAEGEINLILNIALIPVLIGIAVVLSAASKTLKGVTTKSAAAALTVSPVLLFGWVGLYIGFGISFGACYFSGCTYFEDNALFILPIASLILSIPTAIYLKKKAHKKAVTAMRKGSSKEWIAIGVCIILFSSLIAGGLIYDIHSLKEKNINETKQKAEEVYKFHDRP